MERTSLDPALTRYVSLFTPIHSAANFSQLIRVLYVNCSDVEGQLISTEMRGAEEISRKE